VSTAVRRALYGRMAGDTTLNALLGTPAPGFAKAIYHQQAPDEAHFPFVIFQKQSGTPTEAFTDPSALETDVWMVKGVDRNTTTDTAEAIALRIQTLLNDAPLSISGNTLLYLRRQSDVEYPELMEGVAYKHCGALYRLVTD
jgi:Protein of unknown function (DUF3168)